MARARMLKPGFFTNDLLAEVPPLGRLLFAGLWTIADRAGRLADRPRRIRAEVLPYDEGVDVDALLEALAARGFIARYTVDGVALIQIVNWSKHQQPHVNERPSELPAPPEYQSSTVLAPERDGARTNGVPDEQPPGTVLVPEQPDTKTPRTKSLTDTEGGSRGESESESGPEPEGAPAGAAAAAGIPPEAAVVLECWRVAHGKRVGPALNPAQRAAFDRALAELGAPRLCEAVEYLARQGNPRFGAAIEAAYSYREQQGRAPPTPSGRRGEDRPRPRRDPHDYGSSQKYPGMVATSLEDVERLRRGVGG